MSKKLKREEIIERDKDIVSMYKLGFKTLSDIGKPYNLSKERVRQILNKNGIIPSKYARDIKLNTKHKKIDEEIKAKIQLQQERNRVLQSSLGQYKRKAKQYKELIEQIKPILEYYANSYCAEMELKNGCILKYDKSEALKGLDLINSLKIN